MKKKRLKYTREEKKEWMKNVFRTTKCFSSTTENNYPGGFPVGFLKWTREKGWWGEKRAYLCAGGIKDDEAVRVDIKPEVNPTHCEDARKTSLPSNTFDLVIVDPPYSRELAEYLYGTGEHYGRIDSFTKEAARIAKSGGLIMTLSYEVPKHLPDCNFIAVVGVYQVIQTAHMRCFTVSRKL